MVMMVSCPTCRRALGISEENQGKAMRCPLCLHPFLAPARPSPPPPPNVPVFDLLMPEEPVRTWHQPPPIREFPDFEFGPPGATSPPPPPPPPLPEPPLRAEPPPLREFPDFELGPPDGARQAPATPPRAEPPPLEFIPMLGLDPAPAAAESPRGEADYELVPEPPLPLPGRESDEYDQVLPLPPDEDDRDRPSRRAKRDEADSGWYDDRSARPAGRDRPRKRRDLSRREGDGVVVGSGATVALVFGIGSLVFCCIPFLGFPLGLVGWVISDSAMRSLGYRDANTDLLYYAKLASVAGMVLSVCIFVLACSFQVLVGLAGP